jgi:penicillin amidase
MRCILFTLLLGSAAVQTPAQGPSRTLNVDGETVRIVRDSYGVPHVSATTQRGLFYGNGYAAAEDRIAQFDLYRRNARGEMAELVGRSALASDRETRLDGYTEAEREAQFMRCPPAVKTMLAAYTEGVNAFISTAQAQNLSLKPANYPVPFDIHKLRPWRITDSIAIAQMMSRRFGGDQGGELRNQLILGFLKNKYKADAAKLFNDVAWRNDRRAPVTLRPEDDPKLKNWKPMPHWTDSRGAVTARQTAFPTNPSAMAAAAAAERVLNQRERLEYAQANGLPTKWGSYCFAVSAAKSSTGGAMLVGGPQMGFRTPQIAHEIHLSGAGIDCIGMGFAGIPGILIGHNANLAWSTTTGVNDQTDVFVETLHPDDPTQYRYKGQWRRMDRRIEKIEVAGAEPVEMEVFRTVHGPVVQVDKPNKRAYSRMSSYWDRELETTQAFYQFHTARNVKEFGEACRLIVTSHNFFAADKAGDIGFWFCGRSPVRNLSVDPRLPTPGEGDHEWKGILPFEEMPHVINPKSGWLGNWNNKPAVWWDNYDTPVWGEVWHSERIGQLLAAKPKVGPEDLRNILLDIGTNDYTAQVLLPEMLAGAQKQSAKLSPMARQAYGRLAAWDHHATEHSVAKVLFDAWLQTLREELFNDAFGFIRLQGADLFNTAMQPSLILHVLQGKRSAVPAQWNYLGKLTAEELLTKCLNKAVEKLAAARGPEMAAWRHTQGRIRFAPLPDIVSTDRGTYIQIVECLRSGLRGISILPPGQSERTDSPHFGDQRELAGWFQFKPMLTRPEEIERSTLKR